MIDPMSADAVSIDLPNAVPRKLYPTRRLLQPSPDYPDDYVLEIDYSSLSKYICCPRSYENYAVHSREADRSQSATDFGKLFHQCEELRMRVGFNDTLRQRQREIVVEHFQRLPVSPTDHRTAERMLAVLKQYEERWAHDEYPSKILIHEGEPFIERPFKIPLCTIPIGDKLPFRPQEILTEPPVGYNGADYTRVRCIHVVLTGRIDAALIESNLLWVIDNKTSSRGGDEFESAFRLSLQTRGYAWALQRIVGAPVAGLIMNALVILAPTQKLFNNTKLARIPYPYSQDSLTEWEENVKATVSDLVHSLVRGFFPQHGLSFKSPCAGCDYAENCGLPREQRVVDLASDSFRNVTWNPIHD